MLNTSFKSAGYCGRDQLKHFVATSQTHAFSYTHVTHFFHFGSAVVVEVQDDERGVRLSYTAGVPIGVFVQRVVQSHDGAVVVFASP